MAQAQEHLELARSVLASVLPRALLRAEVSLMRIRLAEALQSTPRAEVNSDRQVHSEAVTSVPSVLLHASVHTESRSSERNNSEAARSVESRQSEQDHSDAA